jgi:hypothetical protein
LLLHRYLCGTAKRFPHKAYLLFASKAFSFRENDERSGRLTCALRKLAVGGRFGVAASNPDCRADLGNGLLEQASSLGVI